MLDSWVRYEQQEKEQEQAQLVKTVVENVLKNLGEEKTQKEVLTWAVSEVEREYFSGTAALTGLTNVVCRAGQEQGYLNEFVARKYVDLSVVYR